MTDYKAGDYKPKPRTQAPPCPGASHPGDQSVMSTSADRSQLGGASAMQKPMQASGMSQLGGMQVLGEGDEPEDDDDDDDEPAD